MIRKLLAAALVAATSAVSAAPTYIHAGRLLAVPGKAPLGPSTIVVDNGRIVSVTPGLTRVEPGVPVIDLSTRTVLPGLIDSHVHLASDRGGEAGLIAFMREEKQMNALEAQMNGMKTLRAGFTTVRNLGDEGATLALREAVKRGWVQGPRIVDAASSISTTGGHMDGRGSLNDDLVAHLPEPGKSLRQRRNLPPRCATADRPRRRRDQVRDHRRRQQRHRPRDANVRR